MGSIGISPGRERRAQNVKLRDVLLLRALQKIQWQMSDSIPNLVNAVTLALRTMHQAVFALALGVYPGWGDSEAGQSTISDLVAVNNTFVIQELAKV